VTGCSSDDNQERSGGYSLIRTTILSIIYNRYDDNRQRLLGWRSSKFAVVTIIRGRSGNNQQKGFLTLKDNPSTSIHII